MIAALFGLLRFLWPTSFWHVEFDWGTTEDTEHTEMNVLFRVFR